VALKLYNVMFEHKIHKACNFFQVPEQKG